MLSTLAACFRSALTVIGKIAATHLTAFAARFRGSLPILGKIAASATVSRTTGAAVPVVVNHDHAP
jgi:hypothetical protein